VKVDLIRCPAAQGGVGPMLTIPFQDILKLATKVRASQRDHPQSAGNPLDRANCPLDNRNTPVFAHRPKPRRDPMTPAPGLELWAAELLALPIIEQSTFSRWTTEVTISGNLFTGDGICTEARGRRSWIKESLDEYTIAGEHHERRYS